MQHDDYSISSYEGKQNIQKMIDLACAFSEGRHGIYIREVIQNTGVSNYRKIGESLGMTAAQFAIEVGKFFCSADRVAGWKFATLSRWISNGAMYLAKYRRLGVDRDDRPKAKGFWVALEEEKTPQGEFYRAFYKPLLVRDRYLKTQDMFAQAFSLFDGVPAEKLRELKDQALNEREWTIPYGYLKKLATEAKPKPAKPTPDNMASLYADNPIFACIAKACGAPAVANWFSKVDIIHSPEAGKMVIRGRADMPMAVEWIQTHYKIAMKALKEQFKCDIVFEDAPKSAAAQKPSKPASKIDWGGLKRELKGYAQSVSDDAGFRSFASFAPPGA